MYTRTDLSSCPLWAHLSDMLQGAPLQKLPLCCSLSQKSANTSTDEWTTRFLHFVTKKLKTLKTPPASRSSDVGKILYPYFWSMSCIKRLPWWKYFLITCFRRICSRWIHSVDHQSHICNSWITDRWSCVWRDGNSWWPEDHACDYLMAKWMVFFFSVHSSK